MTVINSRRLADRARLLATDTSRANSGTYIVYSDRIDWVGYKSTAISKLLAADYMSTNTTNTIYKHLYTNSIAIIVNTNRPTYIRAIG